MQSSSLHKDQIPHSPQPSSPKVVVPGVEDLVVASAFVTASVAVSSSSCSAVTDLAVVTFFVVEGTVVAFFVVGAAVVTFFVVGVIVVAFFVVGGIVVAFFVVSLA